MKLIQSESYKKGVVLSVLFNIISKGILFILTIIIARYFGSNIKTDIYFFVFASMILFSGFINSIDTAVLIPESMRIREKEGNEKAAAFLNFFLLIYFFIGVAFLLLMYFFGTAIFGLISKFSEADIVFYRNYFWIGSFFFVFHILTNYINTILTSLKYFSLPMLISSVKSCITIACIFLLKEDYDVLSVFLGGLIAYALNLIFLLVVMKHSLGWKFSFKLALVKKKTWSNIFYAELGQITTVASSMLPLYLLSGFGSGIISVMNYGKNIADIPNTLITSQFANVTGIKLNEQAAQLNYEGMNSTFLRIAKLIVFILVPVGFFMFVFAEPVVELLYMRGSFTQEAVTQSAMFLRLLAVSIFSVGINAMVTRVFIAMLAIRQSFYYQITLNILLIVAIWLFTTSYGAYGYPYAVILLNMINYIGMYFICKKLFKTINYAALLKYSGWVFALNIPVAVALFYAMPLTGIGTMYQLLIGIFVYAMLFVAMTRIKKITVFNSAVKQ